MVNERQAISLAAARLADRLPYAVMLSISNSLSSLAYADQASIRHTILQGIPTPEFRDFTADFLDDWFRFASHVSAEAVAIAVMTAAQCEQDHRNEESVEVVWTGPEPAGHRFRRTEQAILEVIDTATQRLTIVSYAVYRIPRIQTSLVAAANRGVRINVIVETPNKIEGQGEYDCLLALGSKVASASSVYFWPQENRWKDDNGKVGILHVKCAVADGQRMFLSSANFTEYAFTINMELGLLVSGGKLARQVENHFDQLITIGQLHRI